MFVSDQADYHDRWHNKDIPIVITVCCKFNQSHNCTYL